MYTYVWVYACECKFLQSLGGSVEFLGTVGRSGPELLSVGGKKRTCEPGSSEKAIPSILPLSHLSCPKGNSFLQVSFLFF